MDNQEFVQSAHPHSWFLVADNLYSHSVELYSQMQNGMLTQINGEGKVLGEWPNSSRSTFLLAGFALENAIKAFLVYEYPHWVSNGTLARPLRSHALVQLSRKSTIIPWQKRAPSILSSFEAGLESWARYPCALSAADTQSEQNLSTKLWRGYIKLMEAYGRSLMSLLSEGWDGPYGLKGRLEFEGAWLGAKANKAK